MRTSLKISWCLAVLLLLGVSLPAIAAVKVGDKPKINWQTINNQQVTNEVLRGKIVIVDFWATWCRPCIEAMPHMRKLNSEYVDKGVQIIGISLDTNKRKLMNVVNKHKLVWPQVFEGQGWEGDTPKACGVNSIPRVFILSPEGEVLWSGHPANMQKNLEAALRDHPPQIEDDSVDEAVIDAALQTITTAKQAVDDGDVDAVLEAVVLVEPDALQNRRVRLNLGILFKKVQIQLADGDRWREALVPKQANNVA